MLEAIKQVPAYAKFLKYMCTYKRKSKSHDPKKVNLDGQVRSILQCNMPPKFKDPGIPTISCFIGDYKISNALLDFRSSVNLIPYSIYEKLGLVDSQPANMTLQLANMSFRVPAGKINDVLVKVDNGFFPVGFIVLDIGPHLPKNNILLFWIATIKCRTKVIEVSILNMSVKFNVFKTSSLSSNADESACLLFICLIILRLPPFFRKILMNGCLLRKLLQGKYMGLILSVMYLIRKLII